MNTMQELAQQALEKAQSTTAKVSKVGTCWVCGRDVEMTPANQHENSATLRCQSCLDLLERTRQEQVARNAQLRIERLMSQVPGMFQRTQRDKLPRPEKLDQAMRWRFGAKGLLLFGPTGCGKSRVLWEIAKREILKGVRVRHVSPFEIMRYPALFMSAGDAAGKFADELIAAQLLLLDDVFKAKPTERVEELLFAVIDERGAHERPCLITLNDTGDSLESRLSSDRGPALIRRLRSYCDAIMF